MDFPRFLAKYSSDHKLFKGEFDDKHLSKQGF